MNRKDLMLLESAYGNINEFYYPGEGDSAGTSENDGNSDDKDNSYQTIFKQGSVYAYPKLPDTLNKMSVIRAAHAVVRQIQKQRPEKVVAYMDAFNALFEQLHYNKYK